MALSSSLATEVRFHTITSMTTTNGTSRYFSSQFKGQTMCEATTRPTYEKDPIGTTRQSHVGVIATQTPVFATRTTVSVTATTCNSRPNPNDWPTTPTSCSLGSGNDYLRESALSHSLILIAKPRPPSWSGLVGRDDTAKPSQPL